MLPLLIIGGGIQGSIIALALLQRWGREYLRVLDPHPQLLSIWKRNCHACGMRYLRSPGAHNIENDPLALFRFVRSHRLTADYHSLYQRPSLPIFQQHVDHVITHHQLERLHLQGRATAINIHENYVEVESDQGVLHAKRVLYALGSSHYLHIPSWASAVLSHRVPYISHLYDPQFHREWAEQARQPVIVGGGISAAHMAIHLAYASRSAMLPVLVTRRPIRRAHFDSDPCYLGPKCLTSFLREHNYAHRRRLITQVRNPGSLPPDIADNLQNALAEGRCKLIESEPRALTHMISTPSSPSSATMATLRLSNGASVQSDCIMLATGFREMMPHEPLIKETAHKYQLPVDARGTPIVDDALRWHPRLLLSGAPAMLELGPAAPNIIGAHLALRRIVPLLSEDRAPSVTRAWRPIAPPASAPKIALQ